MRFFKIIKALKDMTDTELRGAEMALEDSVQDPALLLEIRSEQRARPKAPVARGDIVTKGKISWRRK